MRLLTASARATAVLGLALSATTLSGATRSRTRGVPAPTLRVAPTGDSLTASERARLLTDLSVLAHDSMEGRRTGTDGIHRARRFLVGEMAGRGLVPAGGTFEHTFRFRSGGTELEAVNLLGMVRGTERPDEYIVVTAHYDHLGVRNGEIYNGADDNASGTAALLAIAARFAAAPPRHSILFAAFDAEEIGLRGARELVADPPVALESIVLNVNLDMVSRSEAGELYAAGTHHYPFLAPLVLRVADDSKVTVLLGHDTPDLPPGDDWTLASDHGPFHEAGIPFLYFGVEDHPGYHAPSDDFAEVTPEFFIEAVETILDFVRLADTEGEAIRESSGRIRS